MKDLADFNMREGIREGSVFYFEEPTFSLSFEPHYFVVLNHNPKTDKMLILVCASTQSLAVKLRSIDCDPNKTLVEVLPRDCSFLRKESIFDCNRPLEKHLEELIDMLRKRKLQFRGNVNSVILEKLRIAVRSSRLVTKECKNLLVKPNP